MPPQSRRFRSMAGAVGWQRTQKQAKASAAFQMFAEWQSQGGDINGFLAALKPGMTSLQAVAKKLHAEQTERDRCLAEWSQTKPAASLGRIGRVNGPVRSIPERRRDCQRGGQGVAGVRQRAGGGRSRKRAGQAKGRLPRCRKDARAWQAGCGETKAAAVSGVPNADAQQEILLRRV